MKFKKIYSNKIIKITPTTAIIPKQAINNNTAKKNKKTPHKLFVRLFHFKVRKFKIIPLQQLLSHFCHILLVS